MEVNNVDATADFPVNGFFSGNSEGLTDYFTPYHRSYFFICSSFALNASLNARLIMTGKQNYPCYHR